jgi:hypothetical protein
MVGDLLDVGRGGALALGQRLELAAFVRGSLLAGPLCGAWQYWIRKGWKMSDGSGRMEAMAAKTDTVKAKARDLIEQLPDNATWDDVAYEIAVRRSIERGLADLDAERTYTSEALLESLGLQ